jgi:hypothetical protein
MAHSDIEGERSTARDRGIVFNVAHLMVIGTLVWRRRSSAISPPIEPQ